MSWLISKKMIQDYESLLFSPGPVVEYSGGCSSDGGQSAPLKLNPMPQAYLSPDRMTAFSRLSRFGMTFEPLTDDRGEELLMSYLADFRARISPAPEKGSESRESGADSGQNFPESLAKYDLDSRSWKTHQCSLLGGWIEFSGTWPRWGMMRNGELYPLRTPARLTSGKGSGLWPTPCLPGNGGSYGKKKLKEMLWPTTTVNMISGGPNHNSPTVLIGRHGLNLCGAIEIERENFPAPCSSDSKARATEFSTNRRRKMGKQISLEAAIKYPTPTAQDAKNNGSQSQMKRNSQPLNAVIGGQLNPTWVELLMGWPKNWTKIGGNHETEKGTDGKNMSEMWEKNDSTEMVKRETGQHILEPEILQHFMCWLSRHGVAKLGEENGSEISYGDSMQSMWGKIQFTETPQGQKSCEQSHRKYRSIVSILSCERSQNGRDLGPWSERWEDGIPRIASGVAARTDRLKCIGNGQVPAVVKLAWEILTEAKEGK